MNKEIKMLKRELKKREIIKKYKNLLIIYSLAIGKRELKDFCEKIKIELAETRFSLVEIGEKMPDLVSEVQLELQELRNK